VDQPGAKGIALIGGSGEKTSLKHALDLSDTHPMTNISFQL